MTFRLDDELEQRAQVTACLKALEEAVNRMAPARGGIAYNQPPADDEGAPPQDASNPISPAILNTKQAAHYLDLSPSTLAKLRLSGDGPVFIKMRSRVGYQISSLDEFVAQRRRTSTSEAVDADAS